MIPADVIERCARSLYAVCPQRVERYDPREPARILTFDELPESEQLRERARARAVLSAAHADLEREVIEASITMRCARIADDRARRESGVASNRKFSEWMTAAHAWAKATDALLAAREKTGGTK